jgi:hypothetical protein
MRQVFVDKGTSILELEDDQVLGQVLGQFNGTLYPVFRAGTLRQRTSEEFRAAGAIGRGEVNPNAAWIGEVVGVYRSHGRRATQWLSPEEVDLSNKFIRLV